IYACDHYVFPEFKLGNIHTVTIKEINESQANQQFGEKKKHSLSQDCLRCEFRSVCHGGCPKHRFAFSSSGKPDQNYLCHGYKTFFSYSAPYIDLMKKLYQAGHSPAAIMQIIKNKESQ
ncbi:SPASM domain-containing protein, partial [Vibrio lentus]